MTLNHSSYNFLASCASTYSGICMNVLDSNGEWNEYNNVSKCSNIMFKQTLHEAISNFYLYSLSISNLRYWTVWIANTLRGIFVFFLYGAPWKTTNYFKVSSIQFSSVFYVFIGKKKYWYSFVQIAWQYCFVN